MAKPQKWDRHAILGELRRRGMTLTRLAELNNVSPGGFRLVWSRPNSKSEAAIAEFLDVPVEQLFPDRYPKRRARVLDPQFAEETSSFQPAQANSNRRDMSLRLIETHRSATAEDLAKLVEQRRSEEGLDRRSTAAGPDL